MHETATPGLTFRPGTAADIEALAALESALFDHDVWSPALLAQALDGAHYSVLVAVIGDENGTVVGYAITTVAGDVADLLRIGVHPSGQRRGIARKLLDHMVRDARVRGADRMLLEVSSANTGARAFYATAGFEQIDARTGYYSDGTDALVLQVSVATGCTWSA